jgi:hypothetical protein
VSLIIFQNLFNHHENQNQKLLNQKENLDNLLILSKRKRIKQKREHQKIDKIMTIDL